MKILRYKHTFENFKNDIDIVDIQKRTLYNILQMLINSKIKH